MAFKYLTEVKEQPSALSKPIVFLVEGQDDGIVLEQILDERNEDATKIQVIAVKGISRLWAYLAALVKSPDFVARKISHICVVIDADTDFAITEAHAQGEFRKAGLADPKSDAVADKNGVRAGLYVLPNSKDKGELEDLIIHTLAQEQRVQDAQGLLVKHKPAANNFKKPSKRVLQIALALSPQDLCAGLGRGIRNGAFKVGVSELPDLDAFITEFLKP